MKTKLILLIAFSLICFISNAQWQQMNGPYKGSIKSIAAKDSIVIASNISGSGSAFISVDNGYSWKTLTSSSGVPSSCRAFLIDGQNIFAQSYLSTDTGNTWTLANNGLPNYQVTSLVLSGTDIFAGLNGGGVYLTTNNGGNWTAVNTGLTDHSVLSLAINGSNIYAGTYYGIFLSTNYGNNWTSINNGLFDSVFTSIAVMDTVIFAGAENNNLYVSRDNGNSWNYCTVPPPTSLAVSGTNIFVGTTNGVYLSTDTGYNWNAVNTGIPPNHAVTSLAIDGTNIYAGTYSGLYLSSNNGGNWNLTCCSTLRINSFAKMDSLLLSGTFQGGIFLSTDSGTNWSIKNNGLPGLDIRTVAVIGTKVFAGVYGSGVFLSNDTGNTWVAANNGITDYSVRSIIVSGTKLFAGCGNSGSGIGAVFQSTDSGATWTNLQLNVPNTSVEKLTMVGTNLFAAVDCGVFMLPDTGNIWISKNNGFPNLNINSIFYEGNKLFASPAGAAVYVSVDTGLTWFQLTNGLPVDYSYIFCGAFDGTNYFLGVLFANPDSAGIYVSTDNCNSWVRINDGLVNPSTDSFLINGSSILAGTFSSVFKRSLNEITTTVGIKESSSNIFDFGIYPNPAKDYFILQLSTQTKNITAEIYSLMGEIIYKEKFTNASYKRIDMKNIPAGIYFVKVTDGEGYYCKKLIIEHD